MPTRRVPPVDRLVKISREGDRPRREAEERRRRAEERRPQGGEDGEQDGHGHIDVRA